MITFSEHLEFLQKKAIQLRIELLNMLHRAQVGHVGGSLSVMDILVTLYYGQLPNRPVLFQNPEQPGSEEQDIVILSKAHAAPAWYTILADRGFFGKEELQHFQQLNSLLQATPNRKIPGVFISTGISGYGLGASIGAALALKMDHQSYRVICIIGDGELQNGEIWESVLLASYYKLDNLTLIVDRNGLQADGFIRGIVGIEPIIEKFEAFGWKNVPLIDGHNFENLLLSVEKAYEIERRPAVIIAPTTKGKGVPFAENKPFYHANVLSDEEMAEALPYLENMLKAYQKNT